MIYEKEITVEVACGFQELERILSENNFEIKEDYRVVDIYMVKNDCLIDNNYLDVLKKCVLIRNIIENDKETKQITYKYKEFDDFGEIIKQGKINCKVESIEDAKKLLEFIGYNQLIKIVDCIYVYANDVSELSVQLVNDKHIYIEVEEKCNFIDKSYNDIEEMKKVIKDYNIPIVDNNYFVKKAEIELKEKFLG